MTAARQPERRHPRGVGRARADLPLRSRGWSWWPSRCWPCCWLRADRERQYLTSYEQARRELPEAVAHLGDLVSDNPGQADRVREIRSLTDQRGAILAALVANVQANRPPQSRVELLDRNKQVADALIAQLQAMKNEEQRLLAGRQVQARRTWTLTLGAIGLSVLLGVAGGIAAVLLFTSGVTRRVASWSITPSAWPAGSRRCRRPLPATCSASWAGAWSGPGSCSASASRSCASPRPC